jgi:ketosteroid isomerase-like protein
MDEKSPIAIVSELLLLDFRDWPGRGFELLAEDVVLHAASGHVYVGHEGYARWFRERNEQLDEWSFRSDGLEDLGGGNVLVRGAIQLTSRDGERQVQPGAWLLGVRDGSIAFVLFFRTEDEARDAHRRGDDPTTSREEDPR